MYQVVYTPNGNRLPYTFESQEEAQTWINEYQVMCRDRYQIVERV